MTSTDYIHALAGILERIEETQAEPIRAAGGAVARALAGGGILHTFGTGHSHMIAEEAFFRAGGLAPVNPILDSRLLFLEGALESTRAERQPGYAGEILARENVQPGDAAILISNSGRNAVPVEMAMEMKARGAAVIAITNLRQSRAAVSRHASGKRLFELADVVIDNCVPEGDAVMVLPGLDRAMGASSTVAGAAIMNSIAIEAALELQRMGMPVPVLPSANAADASDEGLAELLARAAPRIRYFQP